ncbi:hypothetical protein C8N36_1338 [Pelagimonas varians]|uniref:Uncharacterized protein n=1 Tax=Pelagimonas varians TaxID=696760 RepID=A0A238L640_9RHOB|nr:hypothetical protein C8N36_1338 [Pelagimonas varians]SMX49852.1 hypothetical protein PEV8663_04364 [Pelagimonas varians]
MPNFAWPLSPTIPSVTSSRSQIRFGMLAQFCTFPIELGDTSPNVHAWVFSGQFEGSKAQLEPLNFAVAKQASGSPFYILFVSTLISADRFAV